MRKNNVEQRSAEQLTTEELEHVSGGGGQGVPPPTNYQVWGTLQQAGGNEGVDRGDFGPAPAAQ